MRHLKPILFAVFALIALTISCVEPLDIVSPDGRNRFPAEALIISPQVLGAPATKADDIDGDAARMENKLASLDIFVYRKSGGTNYFFHRYTLNESETQQLVSGRDYLLESNWRTARYQDVGYENNAFKIYVLANLAVNHRDAIPASPTEAELRAFISTSKQTVSGSYDVVRLVDGKGPGTEDWYNPHIKDNLFLMDGVIDNWEPAGNAAQQYFTQKSDKSFDLQRAAAKFKVTLDFDPAFLDILGTADADKLNFTKTEYWPGTQVKMTEVVTNIGNAQYKFANFMPATYDFDPAEAVSAATLKTFRDANLWESAYRYDFSYRTPASTPGSFKYPYVDTTYSYAFSWDASEAAEKAPALAVSIIYTKTTRHYDAGGNLISTDAPVAETNYYRIPLVNVVNATSPVTAVNRNCFYQVDARISSMGSTVIDIEPAPVKLNYKVIPWSFNPATDITAVEGVELLYFTADNAYTLRGENMQSVNLDFFTPKSELLNTGHYRYEPVLSNVRVYFKPDDATTTGINPTGGNQNPGTYSNDGRSWTGTKQNSGESVTISVMPAADGGGYVQISSFALDNRAVKYIEFDASVTFEVPILDANGQSTGDYNNITVTHHYLIQHFPLDNIQSIAGMWSSRWNGVSGVTYFRKRYSRTTSGSISQEEWAAGIGSSNADRKNATSPATAVNGYYATGQDAAVTATRNSSPPRTARTLSITWSGRNSVTVAEVSGTTPRRSWTIDMPYSTSFWDAGEYYDYVDNYTQGSAPLVKYEHYYGPVTEYSYNPSGDGWSWTWEPCTLDEYNATPAENRKASNEPSTGDWVDWGIAYNNGGFNGNTGRTCSIVEDRITFRAKYYGSYYGGGNYGYNLEYDDNSGVYEGTASTGLTNNHMYVIQLSRAEDNVSLGRPVIDPDTHQSNDNVVSPAFMIASQLGASNVYYSDPYTDSRALVAANLCANYMEVATNGRRFTGWRLPTQAEIEYIIGYQDNPKVANAGIFSPVITANHYYTLNPGADGQRYATTTYGVERGGFFVRCIRDLTPAEVAELNGTGTITEATY